MDTFKINPYKMKVLNNYALLEFLSDDLQKSDKLIIVKQNNSTKFRSIYVGRVIDRPEFMYTKQDLSEKVSLDDLIRGESIVAYNPMSIQYVIEWENKKYHLIRVEDIYCGLEGFELKEDKS